MNLLKVNSCVIMGAIITGKNKNIQQVARYMCSEIDKTTKEYQIEYTTLYNYLKRCKGELYSKEIPINEYKLKNLKYKLRKYIMEEEEINIKENINKIENDHDEEFTKIRFSSCNNTKQL